MLSILIPVFNYDASALIFELGRQGRDLASRVEGFEWELLVGDDASTDASLEAANCKATAAVGGTYCRVPQNIGQAYLRNLLSERAKGEWLLMIDSDARVAGPDFLERYWNDRNKADVICGALKNPPGPAPRGCELRYRYEKAAERQRTAAYRNRVPYTCFTAFNAMFRHDVFAAIRFDSRCTEYGYEDVLMGVMLQQYGKKILHTDNALYHMGIDRNASFLEKTETSLRVLSRLGEPMQSVAGASRVYKFMDRLGLVPVVAWGFRCICGLLRRNLLGRHPILFCFQLYKTGYYAEYHSRQVKMR